MYIIAFPKKLGHFWAFFVSGEAFFGIFSRWLGHFFIPRGWQPWKNENENENENEKTIRMIRLDQDSKSSKSETAHFAAAAHFHFAHRRRLSHALGPPSRGDVFEFL